MSMKELLNGDCGQVNPVLRVASHFAGAGTSSEGQGSVGPAHLVGRVNQNHAAHFQDGHPPGRLLPPTTFRMDSLLKEIQSMDRTQGPAQAPRVVDLTSNEDWVQEFQSSDLGVGHGIDQKWTDEFHSRHEPLLDFDRAWEDPNSMHRFPSHHAPVPQGAYADSMHGSARELLGDSKWQTEYQSENRTELMATAEEFLNSMSDPNIQATEFMKFVERLSTGEASLADREKPVGDLANLWANEFQANPENFEAGQNWAQEFGAGGDNVEADSESMNPSERLEFWQKLQSEWDRVAEESDFQHPWLSSTSQFDQPYRFEEENPYKDANDPLEEGRRRLMASDIPAAALLFEAAVQKQADNPEAWYLLGTTQGLNEQDPQAISALSKCVELQPDNLKAAMALAASLTNESFHLQACRTLKSWLKQNPKYSSLVPEDIEKIPSTSSLLPNNELAAVQNLYMKAARQRPAANLDPDIQCGLGILFNLSSDYDKAADCFQAAVNADPTNALLWNRLGATLANGGKSAEAIGAYSQALEIIPGFIRTRYNLGIACVNLGAYKEAAEHFLSALNMQASSKSAVASSVDIKQTMSDSIWTSLRMVLHLLDKGKLSSAIDRRDLNLLNQEFGVS